MLYQLGFNLNPFLLKFLNKNKSMFKSLISTATLTLGLVGQLEQAQALEALSNFVDEIPGLVGLPEFPNTEIPWEFPLTLEETIKMENRFAVLQMQ